MTFNFRCGAKFSSGRRKITPPRNILICLALIGWRITALRYWLVIGHLAGRLMGPYERCVIDGPNSPKREPYSSISCLRCFAFVYSKSVVRRRVAGSSWRVQWVDLASIYPDLSPSQVPKPLHLPCFACCWWVSRSSGGFSHRSFVWRVSAGNRHPVGCTKI